MKQHPQATTATRAPRLSEISPPRQALVRLCQSIDHGQIIDLYVRDGEPVFNPAPTLLLDIKLDTQGGERPESALADFQLRAEVCRLLDRLDDLGTGRVHQIWVRAGIPWRVLIEAQLTEAPR